MSLYTLPCSLIYNVTRYNPVHAITSSLDHDLEAKDSAGGPLPRFESVKIGQTSASLSQCVTQYRFTKEEMLPPANQGLSVEIVYRSVMGVPKTWTWTVTEPTEGAVITIDTSSVTEKELAFEVKALHPERTLLIEKAENGKNGKWEWTFRPALLPWQGFEFTSSLKAPKAAPAQASPAGEPTAAGAPAGVVGLSAQPAAPKTDERAG